MAPKAKAKAKAKAQAKAKPIAKAKAKARPDTRKRKFVSRDLGFESHSQVAHPTTFPNEARVILCNLWDAIENSFAKDYWYGKDKNMRKRPRFVSTYFHSPGTPCPQDQKSVARNLRSVSLNYNY